MAPEVKEYISVNEKDFWKKESLKLTTNCVVLNQELKDIVTNKIIALNKKIDETYNVGWFFNVGWLIDKGVFQIWESQKTMLLKQVRAVIQDFNTLIQEKKDIYDSWNREKMWDIQKDITELLWSKSIFLTNTLQTGQLRSAIQWYVTTNREELPKSETMAMNFNI